MSDLVYLRGISSLVHNMLPGIATRIRTFMRQGHYADADKLAKLPIVQLALYNRLQNMYMSNNPKFGGNDGIGNSEEISAQAQTFSDVVTSTALLNNITFNEMTAVQVAGYGPLSAGKNAIIKAPTGNGKTLSFLVPTLDRLISSGTSSWMLVLSPTRILMHQIAERCAILVNGLEDITVLTTESPGEQQRISHLSSTTDDPSSPRIVVLVTSIGRLLKMIEGRRIDLSTKVGTVILDEADELLEDGSWKSVRTIFTHLPHSEIRQSIFVSATSKTNTVERVQMLLGDGVPFEMVDVGGYGMNTGATSLARITQQRMVVDPKDIGRALISAVCNPTIYAVIFVPSKNLALLVSAFLRNQGIPGARTIIGGMPDKQRDSVLKSFTQRDGTVRVLVATDVIGRGFDTVVDLVVQMSLPSSAEHYTHRIGRTGRVSDGIALSIIGTDEDIAYRSQKKIQLWDDNVVELRELDTSDTSDCLPINDPMYPDQSLWYRAMIGYLGAMSSHPVLKSVWKTDSQKYISAVKDRFEGLGVSTSVMDTVTINPKQLKKMSLI